MRTVDEYTSEIMVKINNLKASGFMVHRVVMSPDVFDEFANSVDVRYNRNPTDLERSQFYGYDIVIDSQNRNFVGVSI